MLTRESEMHRELAQKDRNPGYGASQTRNTLRKDRMEDASGNIVSENPIQREKLSEPPKTSKRLETGKPQRQIPGNSNPRSNTQVMIGSAKRWAEKRVATQSDADNGSGGNNINTQQTKKRKVEVPPKQNQGRAAAPTANNTRSGQSTAAANLGKKSNSNIASEPIASGSNEKRKSYSEVVEETDWDIAMNKSTKKQLNKSKKVIQPISGPDETGNIELFVNGLNCKRFRSQKELEESVKTHCMNLDVNTVYQRVIAFRIGRPTVGCKLVVREEDEDMVRATNFWPKGVTIREWYDENPNSKNTSSEKESEESS